MKESRKEIKYRKIKIVKESDFDKETMFKIMALYYLYNITESSVEIIFKPISLDANIIGCIINEKSNCDNLYFCDFIMKKDWHKNVNY